MNRPAPRKSSLAGASPVAPPTSPPAPVAPEQIADASAAAEVAHQELVHQVDGADATAPAPAVVAKPATSRKSKYPPKVSFYQDPDKTARVRGAILHTMTTEGSRSLSQFIDQAVMEKVEELEAKYNHGEPFPAIGARELPQGRPMGE